VEEETSQFITMDFAKIIMGKAVETSILVRVKRAIAEMRGVLAEAALIDIKVEAEARRSAAICLQDEGYAGQRLRLFDFVCFIVYIQGISSWSLG
jgi:hypothetical protein